MQTFATAFGRVKFCVKVREIHIKSLEKSQNPLKTQQKLSARNELIRSFVKF